MIALLKDVLLHRGARLCKSFQKRQARPWKHTVAGAVHYEDAAIADLFEPGPMEPALFRGRVAVNFLSVDLAVCEDEEAGLKSPIKNFDWFDRMLFFEVEGKRIDPVGPLTYTAGSAQTLDRGELPVECCTYVHDSYCCGN